MNEKSEIRLRGVSHQVSMDIKNISANLGISVTNLLKPKLREIADSYPPNLKRPPLSN